MYYKNKKRDYKKYEETNKQIRIPKFDHEELHEFVSRERSLKVIDAQPMAPHTHTESIYRNHDV